MTLLIVRIGYLWSAQGFVSLMKGSPKYSDELYLGVLITHGSMAMAVYAFQHSLTVEGDRTVMSFLPLAHIFEVCVLSTQSPRA